MSNKLSSEFGYISTWSTYGDSTAYVYQKYGEPNKVYGFHKFYKPNISREILELYHHIHHYLSKKDIPMLDLPGESKDIFGKRYIWEKIKLKILDLNPDNIGAAYWWEEGNEKTGYATKPKFVHGHYLTRIVTRIEDRNHIFQYLKHYLAEQWILLRKYHPDNFLVTRITKNGCLYITVTDLWGELETFCIDNREWANETIAKYKKSKINTAKDLYKTFAQNEAIENTDQNTTTQ